MCSRKITSIIVLMLLMIGCNQTEEKSGTWYYDEAIKVYNVGDYVTFLDYTKKASELMPGVITAKYNLACAYSLNNKTNEAFSTLNKLLDLGYPVNIEADTDFDNIRNDERYPGIIEKLEIISKPVSRSKLAFTIPEIDLIPEGLAYDEGADCFYLGSLHKSKIVKITRDGEISDFTSSRQDGMVSIVGMKVDNNDRAIWASSSYGYKHEPIPLDELGTCEMVKLNLESGELIDKYSLPKEENHFFNDVVLNSDGDAFITDSHVPTVYLVNHVENKLQKFVELDDGLYPNGIALSENQNYIFVAVRNGIIIIDVRDKSTQYLQHAEDVFTSGCDGLYFYKNSLIGVQGFLSRIARFHLTDDLSEVTELEILESFNPDFESPTTGAVVGSEFYYIANAQLRKVDNEGKLFPAEQLKPVKIYKVNLESIEE